MKRPKQAISDYHIKTRIEDMLAKVEIEMKFYSPLNVKISIEDRNGAVVALGSIAEEGKAVLKSQVRNFGIQKIHIYIN